MDKSNETPALDVRDLRMRYGTKDVLAGVTFSAQRGEVLALLGPNGAGKTTTIEILEGFRACGRRVMCPSSAPIPHEATKRGGPGSASCCSPGAITNSGESASCSRIRRGSTRRLPLPRSRGHGTWTSSSTSSVCQTSAHAKIMTLSGGQRRRLDVAIGIVGRPEIVFFDEPTAGFDPHARRDFHDLVHRLSDFENTTILMTTHDLDEAEKIADRILVLDEGRIVADGSADQLARELTTTAEVHWTSGGRRHVHAVREGDPSDFVRDLLIKNPDVTELEVRRASLEDTYMALVRRVESGQSRGGRPDETAAKNLEVQA